MRCASHLRFLPKILLLLLGIAAATTATAREMSETELGDALRRADQFYSTLKHARDRDLDLYERAYDKHNRNLGDYLRDNLLLPEPRQAIELHLRRAREALQSKDLRAAQSALEDVAGRLNEQSSLRVAIERYWRKLGAHRPDRSAYFENLRRNGISPVSREEIESLESELEQQIVARDFVLAMTQTYPKWFELSQNASTAESKAIEKKLAAGEAFEPLNIRRNSRICVGQAASKGSSPSIVRLADPWRDVYPAESKSAGEEGRTQLLIKVGSRGCATEVQVLVASGYADLDDAAMDWALHTRYSPASVDGKPVDATMYYWMKFELEQ